MNPKFIKMLQKKKAESGDMSDNEKTAKEHVVKGLRDMASGMMGDKLKGLKKVTVASDSAEGLHDGLEKAKDLIGHGEEGDELGDSGSDHELDDTESGDDRGDSEMSGDGSPDDEHEDPGMSEHGDEDEETEEELDQKLKDLMAKKAAHSIRRK